MGLGLYALWGHSSSLSRLVLRPGLLVDAHGVPWAFGVGLLLGASFLLYSQVTPVQLPVPTFWQGTVKA